MVLNCAAAESKTSSGRKEGGPTRKTNLSVGRDFTGTTGLMDAHRELEEPATPRGPRLPLQSKRTPGDEFVAIAKGSVVSEAIPDEVEADGSEASIKQVL